MSGRGGKLVLITGGAGFVGTSLAHRLLSAGRPVRLFDTLARAGVERNLAWLREMHGAGVEHVHADVRDAAALLEAVRDTSAVFHLAAQVAVTSSLDLPRHDFEVNVGGTLNVLEALRALPTPVPLVFTSTNKVYGDLNGLALREEATRYRPENPEVAARGVSEVCPLDFHSPYGCSKGAADQYVLDYARSYGLPTVVFRMSCVYGPHQFGTEDQGWVAHFLLRALSGEPITLFGDGKQVRDILFVEDLIDAFELAERHAESLAGRAFNIGGGPQNTVSLLELLRCIGELEGKPPELKFGDERPGDQRYYVSDVSKFNEATGWTPRVGVREGLKKLHAWLLETRGESQSEAQLVGRA